MPRFLEVPKNGFNDLGMYTLITREFLDAKIDKRKEREIKIDKMKKIIGNGKQAKTMKVVKE